MSISDTPFGRPPRHRDCSTTGSFANHDIDDGHVLITGTYYRLQEEGLTGFEPTTAFLERLEVAFIRTYLEHAPEGRIDNHMLTALEDARHDIAEEFTENAGLRTEVIPAYYQAASTFHCLYH